MMGLKLKNNAASSLAASLSAGETLVSVLAGHGARFPVLNTSDWFPLAVQDVSGNIEYMRVTARAGDAMMVVRGQESTIARNFEAGDLVFLPLTTGALAALGLIGAEPSIYIDDATVTA